MNTAAWLQSLGLERYEPLFRDNEIDWEVLPKLTSDDLREIGVVVIGHRRKLLDAIAALGAVVPATETPAAVDAPAPADAERRQLTVLFCDLVGSTALSSRLDPEDLREVIAAYHRTVAESVAEFDGFVAKYMVDGVLVYFGYPRAHEDDAERAVRAGLGAIDAVGRVDVKSTKLQARVGIATGLAIVGDLIGEGSAREQAVVGETPNLAARLQALATPNTLVIGDATRRQIGGLFDAEDLGPQRLAGFAEPQGVWRVLGESGEVSRFEALRSGETPLVGREEEVELLTRRWRQAKSGEGRVVLISGEPGIGKSRLTAALSEQIEAESHTRLRYFCSPHHEDSALYPFIAQLEHAAGFVRGDAVGTKLGKLQTMLAPGTPHADEVALLTELLSLPSNAADFNLSPQRKREKIFEAILNQLEAEARRRPVLMVFEDAHWIDPTSRELLDLTVDRVRQLPMLLAISFRPEFQPPWSGRSHVTSLVLESVGQGDRVAKVLATASPAALSVPATLHASLMARLDRLGPVSKEVAQIGAVLGRGFAYELIELVAQRDERELQAALGQLSAAELLFCRGAAPHSSYLFKHAPVQDAAYSTLLRGRRQELHAQAAAALDAHFSDLVEREPELLAHHLTAAGDTARAIDQWLKAGRHAAARFAHMEAIRHFERGLEAVAVLPEGLLRDGREIELQLARGPSLFTAKGFAAADAAEAYTRARELAEQRDDARQLFMALNGLWQSADGAGMILECRKLSIRLQQLTANSADDDLRLQAHHSAWATCLFSGEPAAGREHCEVGRRLYDPERHRLHHQVYGGHDPGMCVRYLGAQIYWLLGYPEKGLALGSEALALADRIAHPFSLAIALQYNSMLHLDRGEPELAMQRLDAALALAAEQRLGFVLEPQLLRGAALTARGALEEAVACVREGLEGPNGSTRLRYYGLAKLADTLTRRGEQSAGLAAAREGLSTVEKTGHRQWEAELLRLEGVALCGLNMLEDSQNAFEEALRVARKQHAKANELRAATSLARLWGEQGRRAEARDLLAPVYGWFTEGFDTADLKEAKALLDELT